MSDRCLLAASLAVLAMHPSTTIRCVKKKTPSSPTRFSYHESKVKQEFQTNGNHLFSVSEISPREPTFSILEKIVKLGRSHDTTRRLTIDKVFRINHASQILNRFESYRERIKSQHDADIGGTERIMLDGNEVLKFHGTIITCSFGIDGCALICDGKSCGLCRFITSCFSAKTTGPILVSEDSAGAHKRVAEKCLVNGRYARKSIVICRVIAGNVGHRYKHGLVKGQHKYDGVVSVSPTKDSDHRSGDFVVMNPKALLPCFVVIYEVNKVNGSAIDFNCSAFLCSKLKNKG